MDLGTELKRLVVVLNEYYQKDDYFLKRGLFPLKNPEDLFVACSDGILFCRLAMMAAPGIIPEKKLNLDVDIGFIRIKVNSRGRRGGDPNTRSIFQITQNLNLLQQVLSKFRECEGVSITSEEILAVNYEAVIFTLNQLLRIATISRVSLNFHPELALLIKEGESVDILQMMDTEKIILRWINYHLLKASSPLVATNLTHDLRDSGILLTLLKEIVPHDLLNVQGIETALAISPTRPERTGVVVETICKLRCAVEVTAKEIVTGDRAPLLACLSALFDRFPALKFPTMADFTQLEETVRDLHQEINHLRENAVVIDSNKQVLAEADQLQSQVEKLSEENQRLKLDVEELEDEVQRKTLFIEKLNQEMQRERESFKQAFSNRENKAKAIDDALQEILKSKNKVFDEHQQKVKKVQEELQMEKKARQSLERSINAGSAGSAITPPPESESMLDDEVKERKQEIEEEEQEEGRKKEKATTAEEGDKKKVKSKKQKKGKDEVSKSEVPVAMLDQTKQQVLEAEKKIRSLEERNRNLEEELEEERKAFSDLIELQKKHAKTVQTLTSTSLTSRKNIFKDDCTKKEKVVLEEALKLLVHVLGREAEDVIKKETTASNLAAQVKLLVQVLVDIKESMDKRITSMEHQLETLKPSP